MMVPTPILVSVDMVVLDPYNRLLVIKRKNPPFAGCYALPGGFVDPGETVDDAARRELREETGIIAQSMQLIGVFSNPNRDSRGRVISVAFQVMTWVGDLVLVAGDDAAAAEWVNISDINDPLAFDHDHIVRRANSGRYYIAN